MNVTKLLLAVVAVAVTAGAVAAQPGNGRYVIRNVYSGKVIDVPIDGWSERQNGTQMQQYTANGGDNQQFRLFMKDDWSTGFRKQYELRSVYSSKNLEFAGRSGNGAPLRQWDVNSGSVQKWRLVDGGLVVLPGATTSVRAYYIENVSTGKVVDVPSHSTGNVGLQAYTRNNGTNQLWVFEYKGQ